ncbi:hypothetical protein DDZ14_17260 [Maritimibacter sp. 55A14]|uniref:DUF5665 domain-containing protein n=1 Tax=Maritimibacter sp. 55A14 TaxID=2174844 RepID=UPI000D6219CF|nr:DUF5665 domain-containing protein [Maritimibacter sp. 55A14]PWE29405.1 hypothetical protein DDZ14_17260 [Maritimibacter sp. 55A14]
MAQDQDSDARLAEELAALRGELQRLNRHRFVRMHNNLPKLLGFNFARGMAFGLGSVMGATILVSIAVFLLSQIDFLPVIGEWAKQIAEQIEAAE